MPARTFASTAVSSLVALAGLLLLTGCPPIVVTGEVTDASGMPIEDADIVDRYNDTHLAKTNEDGEYVIQAKHRSLNGEKQALLEIRAEGYAPQITPVPYQTGVDIYKVPIRLVPVQQTAIVAGQQTVLEGYAEGNRFVVVVEPLSNDGLFLQIGGAGAGTNPGTMRDVDDDRDYGLQTAGMMWVAIVDEDGEEWDGDADIQIQMDPYAMDPAEDAGGMNSYFLNPDGLWEREDGLDAPENGAGFDAGFPGWTNCDRSTLLACAVGKVTVDGGGTCQGGRVEHAGLGFSGQASTGSDGSFCIEGGYMQSLNLVMGGASVWSGPLNEQAGNCTRPETCHDVGDVTVLEEDVCGEQGDAPPDADPGVSPGCAEMIQQAHDLWDAKYGGDPCTSSCAHGYYDCLEDSNCEYAESCLSELTACAGNCA